METWNEPEGPDPAEAAAILAAADHARTTANAGVRLEPWYGPALGGFEAVVFLAQLLPSVAASAVVLVAVVLFVIANNKQINITGVRYRLRDHKGLFVAIVAPLAVLYAGSFALDHLAGQRWAWAVSAVLVFTFLVLFVRHWNAVADRRGAGRPGAA